MPQNNQRGNQVMDSSSSSDNDTNVTQQNRSAVSLGIEVGAEVLQGQLGGVVEGEVLPKTIHR